MLDLEGCFTLTFDMLYNYLFFNKFAVNNIDNKMVQAQCGKQHYLYGDNANRTQRIIRALDINTYNNGFDKLYNGIT